MPSPLWEPSPERVARARITAFTRDVEARWRLALPDYESLYRFSIERPGDFWRSVWDFGGVAGERGERDVLDIDRMPGARFFPDARINFAENLLRRRDAAPAIVAEAEGLPPRTLTHADLYEGAARFAAALRAHGIRPGDRIAAYLPNVPEAIVAVLGAAAVGAVWSSCSPDFGVQGVLDRFGQIDPRILIATDAYGYGGQVHDTLARTSDVARALATLERVIIVPSGRHADIPVERVPHAVRWDEFVAGHGGETLAFEPLPFNHPLYILYSSGTTGIPKCIVHGAGGTLVQHLKEHQLHCDIQAGDRVFYFTTAGWMMWNWLVSVLASEGRCCSTTGRLSIPTATCCSISPTKRE
jgi:acetoacetyl-CoA synthetase